MLGGLGENQPLGKAMLLLRFSEDDVYSLVMNIAMENHHLFIGKSLNSMGASRTVNVYWRITFRKSTIWICGSGSCCHRDP